MGVSAGRDVKVGEGINVSVAGMGVNVSVKETPVEVWVAEAGCEAEAVGFVSPVDMLHEAVVSINKLKK